MKVPRRNSPSADLRPSQRIQSFSKPRKIRDLIRDLEEAGFINRGGRGSHRNFVHPQVTKPLTIAGHVGDDAKKYQEQAVKRAIKESQS